MHDTSADRNPPKQEQRAQHVSSPLVELTTARALQGKRRGIRLPSIKAVPTGTQSPR